MSNEIVPDDWQCTRAVRTEDSIDIQFGPIEWRMTDRQLWVSVTPDCPLDNCSEHALGPLFLDQTIEYLKTIPYLPVRRFWLFWKLSVTDPERYKWLANTFLSNEWPVSLGIPIVRPLLISRKDDLVLHMTIRDERTYRGGELNQDSIVFDCYIYRDVGQTPSEIIVETQNWKERFNVVEQAIRHLLEEGDLK